MFLGLKPAARRILNNMMLYHAVNAGLDGRFLILFMLIIRNYDKEVRCSAEDLSLTEIRMPEPIC